MSVDQELLEFGSIDVYYILWERPDAAYYLKDMSPGMEHIEWTKNKRVAFYFYTEKETAKLARILSRSRMGVGFETGEINILDDIELEDMFP